MTRLVCISDTHNQIHKFPIPDGDILIHAGDHTGRGEFSETYTALKRLGALRSKFKDIVCTAGNHDFLAERMPNEFRDICKDFGITYLDKQEATVQGLRIYGVPDTPEFCNWAFNRTDQQLVDIWSQVPKGIHVLISHGPPFGFGDKLDENGSIPGANVGDKALLDILNIIKPKLHVFGHIHCGYGVYDYNGIALVNASICTEKYKPTNNPIVVNIDVSTI